MKFGQKLISGKVIKRYKRFLTDIMLDSGEMITAHTANTGSMTSCIGEHWQCLVSYHDNPKRKLKYSLEMTKNDSSWIGVNTSMPNKLAIEAIQNGVIVELSNYDTLKPEKTIGDSRIDIYLSNREEECYVEVKNVTLKKDNIALFPDSVTTRGQKHLKELIQIKKSGIRACMLFVVQREDVQIFKPALEIDPEYSKLLSLAKKEGVEILVYQCKLSPEKIEITHSIPFQLSNKR